MNIPFDLYGCASQPWEVSYVILLTHILLHLFDKYILQLEITIHFQIKHSLLVLDMLTRISMIEEGARRRCNKWVLINRSVWNGALRYHGHTIHIRGPFLFNAVPVESYILIRDFVLYFDHHYIVQTHMDSRPRALIIDGQTWPSLFIQDWTYYEIIFTTSRLNIKFARPTARFVWNISLLWNPIYVAYKCYI